jgi:hypothetical protein
LPKGNGVPLAILEKLNRNCMRYTIYFWEFAKRAQISFGNVAKGNHISFESNAKRKQTTFCKIAAG